MLLQNTWLIDTKEGRDEGDNSSEEAEETGVWDSPSPPAHLMTRKAFVNEAQHPTECWEAMQQCARDIAIDEGSSALLAGYVQVTHLQPGSNAVLIPDRRKPHRGGLLH